MSWAQGRKRQGRGHPHRPSQQRPRAGRVAQRDGAGRRAGCRGRGSGGASWVPVQAARLMSCLCCVRRGVMYPVPSISPSVKWQVIAPPFPGPRQVLEGEWRCVKSDRAMSAVNTPAVASPLQGHAHTPPNYTLLTLSAQTLFSFWRDNLQQLIKEKKQNSLRPEGSCGSPAGGGRAAPWPRTPLGPVGRAQVAQRGFSQGLACVGPTGTCWPFSPQDREETVEQGAHEAALLKILFHHDAKRSPVPHDVATVCGCTGLRGCSVTSLRVFESGATSFPLRKARPAPPGPGHRIPGPGSAF